MTPTTLLEQNKDILDKLYRDLNRRRYVHPDPLEFLYHYEDPADREIVAVIASSLAFGQVMQILKSVDRVLEPLGPQPVKFLIDATPAKLAKAMEGFKYRFVTTDHAAALLTGIRRIVKKQGGLEACFRQGIKPGDETVLPAVGAFLISLKKAACGDCGYLLPKPQAGSACKRMMLMLRWLIRKDRVDPGGWDDIPSSKLIIPLDTHMHKISLGLGLTKRKSADMQTALEITAAFRTIAPTDPVRYDFCLTRLGIRNEMNIDGFLAQVNA